MNFIFSVLKADWNSREKYFAKYPADFIYDRVLTTIVGFPICYSAVNWLINVGFSPYTFIPVVVGYWILSIPTMWRILRSRRSTQ